MRDELWITWNVPKPFALNLSAPLLDRLSSEISFRDVQLYVLYQSMLYNNKYSTRLRTDCFKVPLMYIFMYIQHARLVEEKA